MFCPKCGTENPDNGKFCRHCGIDISAVSVAINEGISAVACGSKKSKRGGLDAAIAKFSVGVSFLVISIALSMTPNGSQWWFWMLIPAFACMGSGIAQFMQYRQTRSRLDESSKMIQMQAGTGADAGLPPANVSDFVRPANPAAAKTGEFVPTSVTEDTTRHLNEKEAAETIRFAGRQTER